MKTELTKAMDANKTITQLVAELSEKFAMLPRRKENVNMVSTRQD